jgi:hypothetical protein
MTKDEALDLALEALKQIYTAMPFPAGSKAITAIKQACSAPVQEPVAFFDWYDSAHWGNEDFKEGCHRSWNAAIKYTTPPAAQPAPCTWTKSNDPHMPDTFDATCGVVWTFTDGGPAENDVRFCPGCGGKVVEGQP